MLESLHEHRWDTRKELALVIFDQIETWYHPSRRHSYYGMLLPAGLDENGSASFAEDVSACLHADAKRRRLMTAVTDRRAPKCFL
jgi:transposase InsO family protein